MYLAMWALENGQLSFAAIVMPYPFRTYALHNASEPWSVADLFEWTITMAHSLHGLFQFISGGAKMAAPIVRCIVAIDGDISAVSWNNPGITKPHLSG
jgi:hypothetical protein